MYPTRLAYGWQYLALLYFARQCLAVEFAGAEPNAQDIGRRNAPHGLFAREDDDADDGPGGLDGLEPGAKAGAIAGIVVGVVLIVAASIWCCCWPCCCFKGKKGDEEVDRFSQHETCSGDNVEGSKPVGTGNGDRDMENGMAHGQQADTMPNEPPPAYHEVR